MFSLADRVQTTIAADITSGATSITVASGAGALFPASPSATKPIPLVIVNGDGTVYEKVLVTARSGDTLTVTRNQGGTNQAWTTGAACFIDVGTRELDGLRLGSDITAAENWAIEVGGTAALSVSGTTSMATAAKGLTVNTTAASNAFVVSDSTGQVTMPQSTASGGIRIGSTGPLSIYSTQFFSVIKNATTELAIGTSSAANLSLQVQDTTTIAISGASRLVTVSRGMHVDVPSDGAIPALVLDQDDADQEFIDFQGTSAANASNNLSTLTAGNTVQGFIRVAVNGTGRWIAYYDAPTS